MDRDAQYAAEYHALDAEAHAACLALAPELEGAAVPLSALDELCFMLRRPVRDDSERQQLMIQLDLENTMCIDRGAFTAWLLQDLFHEKQLELERLHDPRVGNNAPPVLPAATPTWEQIVNDGECYYYSTSTGESAWALEPFVAKLWNHLVEQDEIRLLRAPLDADGFTSGQITEWIDELRALFAKFDDDRSGSLDTSEFQDLCVAIGLVLGTDSGLLLATMQSIDPVNGWSAVSLDALLRFWTIHAPFQRRAQLAPPWECWERVERLDARATAPCFRHVTTQSERWSHPQTEQNAVEMLTKLFPSAKLEWKQRIGMFYDLQCRTTNTAEPEQEQKAVMWTLKECRAALVLFDHDCTRREHVLAAVQAIQAKYGGAATPLGLALETVEAWLLHCVARVDMDGWEECVDESSGQRYFYHETQGLTQWDPPHLDNRMATMLARFSGDASNADDKIKRIFRHYDEDESGSISFAEFRRLYVALLGRKEAVSETNNDQQIQQVFSMLDTSGDDQVSLDEFLIWWKTKMNIAEQETEQEKRTKIARERKRIALEFLQHHDALVVHTDGQAAGREDEPEKYFFESNTLPRLVGVLGKYALKGLAYRDALSVLVAPSNVADQQINLVDFLRWFADFEATEREKEELAAQKARAAALLEAQEAQAKEKARKLKMIRKGQLLTKAIASDAAAVGGTPEPAEIVWIRHVQTLFRKFDKDNSGFLDAAELQELTQALGHTLTQAQIRQMMLVMDSSGDERVSVDEFVTFWTAFQRRKQVASAEAGSTKTKTKHKKKKGEEPHRREAISMVDASAQLSVSIELAKERALQLTLGDVKHALGDWKETLMDRSRNKKEAQQLAQQNRLRLEQLKKEWAAFVPTRKRRYAQLDVTWIEPEVVRCVVDLIHVISSRTRPLQSPDAAQRIQRIMRGVVTRMRVFAMVQERFRAYVDLDTSFFYYVDVERRCVVWLHRPVFHTITSVKAPWDLDDCESKVERFQFRKRQREMEAKKLFHHCLAPDQSAAAPRTRESRQFYSPACFFVFHVLDQVRVRLVGSLWQALRDRQFTLAELIAGRHWRQLAQRSDLDSAAPLPLHHVVQHHREFPFRLLRAIYRGHPDAVRARDTYGRTPLHLALRERASMQIMDLLLSQRHLLVDEPTRTTQRRLSVWQMQSVSGETPLHVAVRSGVSLELLRWIGRHPSFQSVASDAVKIRNAHGESVFHLVISTLFTSGVNKASYWRSVVLIFLRTWSGEMLCRDANGAGDLPLHIAIQRYAAVLNQRAMNRSSSSCSNQAGEYATAFVQADDDHVSWQWLIRLLIETQPNALLVPRQHDSLLAVHLLLRAVLVPEALVVESLTKTITTANEEQSSCEEGDVLILRETNMTLLHYVLLHRATSQALLDVLMGHMARACRVKMLPSAELPLHLAARHGASVAVLKCMCEAYGAACQERNANKQLPLHLAITSAVASEDAVRLLLHYCPFVLSDAMERRGLRSLVMAANVKTPNASVIRALLDHMPAQKLSADAHKRQVTPLFAISLRKCSPELVKSGILHDLESKFEDFEDEDAYFLAMAKAKHRKQHHCPTVHWTFEQILALMERNPVDEAIVQRALLAINQKLRKIQGEGLAEACAGDDRTNVVVETVTLNAEWMLVRRLHQTLYELPWNARVQLLGQAALAKLLPTAFAKAAYKARIDPYFNL